MMLQWRLHSWIVYRVNPLANWALVSVHPSSVIVASAPAATCCKLIYSATVSSIICICVQQAVQ
jgi:hypothetical protein